MEKSPEAFRTIREVAEGMDLPQHVLRFWETRFPQIRPLKRAGGRRYYRPDDVERLRLIKRLLYEEGYTIRGVQKLFREQGAQALVHRDFEPRPRPPMDAAPAFDAGEPPPLGPDREPAIAIDEDEPEAVAGDMFAERPEIIAAPPVRPILNPQDLDALRAVLADLLEAERLLAHARSQESP